jgi:subtilase family serine protease
MWNHAYFYGESNTANFGAPRTGAPSNWSLGGGTSFRTPVIAGMRALVKEHLPSMDE